MAYDGLVTGAMTIYLSSLLAGGRIDKIYQPDGDELIFHIHNSGKKYRLYISSNSNHPRIHLLDVEKEQSNPQNPAPFCMLLRKHFQGGRIKEIRQFQSERIVELDINHVDELGFPVSKRLSVEIMGKHSNIIAIDLSTMKILDSIKRVSSDINRYRQILPGLPYIYPPNQGKICFYTLTKADLAKTLLRTDVSLPEALVKDIQGINPTIAEEICQRAVMVENNNMPFSEDNLFQVISQMAEAIHTGDYKTRVYVDKDGKPKDFHIFPLIDEEILLDKITFDNPSNAVEYFYTHKVTSNRIRQKSTDLMRALTSSLDRLYLKKQKLEEELYAASNSEDYRIFGELLTANLHTIKAGAPKANVINYYDNTRVDIDLDPRISPSANAQRYFKKYSKAKIAIREKKTQLVETDNSIDYLESVSVYVDNADTIDEIEEIRQELAEGGYLRRRKKSFKTSKSRLQPFAFTAGDGSRILVGRNNKENDHLTLKVADKKDLWFHTKDIPGSHVILLTHGKTPSEEAIRKAASLAAYYSKARNSANVAVDYTLIKHVKKPNGAKPGMVIYTDHKTIYTDPDGGASNEISQNN